jgi:hypothetical protein
VRGRAHDPVNLIDPTHFVKNVLLFFDRPEELFFILFLLFYLGFYVRNDILAGSDISFYLLGLIFVAFNFGLLLKPELLSAFSKLLQFLVVCPNLVPLFLSVDRVNLDLFLIFGHDFLNICDQIVVLLPDHFILLYVHLELLF